MRAEFHHLRLLLGHNKDGLFWRKILPNYVKELCARFPEGKRVCVLVCSLLRAVVWDGVVRLAEGMKVCMCVYVTTTESIYYL